MIPDLKDHSVFPGRVLLAAFDCGQQTIDFIEAYRIRQTQAVTSECDRCRPLQSMLPLTDMIVDALHRIANHRQSLSRDEARAVMSEVLTGKCTDAQIGALLVALHMKGETVEEIVGFAEAIRSAAAPLPIASDSAIDVSGTERDALVDTCGTGGDASGTFNISTATALVAAGAGVRVAKHGNRSVTSKCGSADVMEALGVNISLPPAKIAECLQQVGIAFLFAPAMHSAMKYVQPARRELRLRTVFNLLGPLTNPAHASAQVVGVYSDDLVEKLAEALSMLGLRRAMVVHGSDGLDEITISGPTRVAEVRDGQVRTYEVTPEEFGLDRHSIETLSGGDAAENARIIREVLLRKKSPCRDVVLLNAAATLVAAGRVNHLSEGMPLAGASIDSGAAAAKLKALVEFTNQQGEAS
jgi:anthranilate phosphoribosyltransferase